LTVNKAALDLIWELLDGPEDDIIVSELIATQDVDLLLDFLLDVCIFDQYFALN